jgi:PEP-CTERM motif
MFTTTLASYRQVLVQTLGTAVCVAALATPAHAVTFTSVSGGTSGADFGSVDMNNLFVDASFTESTPIRFIFTLEAADPSTFTLSGIARGISGFTLPALKASLGSAGSFNNVGDVSLINNMGAVGGPVNQGSSFVADFAPATTEVYFGDALLNGAALWTMSLTGVPALSSFVIEVSPVPEPESVAFLLAGLGLVAAAKRRTKRV